MRKIMKTVAVLAVVSMLFTGCKSTGENQSQTVAPQTNQKEEESGKYLEKEITTPENQTIFQATIQADGTPEILAFMVNEKNKKYAAYRTYQYNNNQWAQGEFAQNNLFAKNKVAVCYQMLSGADGSVFALQNKALEEDKADTLVVWKMDKTNANKLFNIPIREYQDMQLLPDGKIGVLSQKGKLTYYDTATGKKTGEYSEKICYMKTVGDVLYVVPMTYDKIQALDVKSGEVLEEYANDLTQYGLSVCEDTDENVYCVTEKGIFKIDDKSGKLEQVISSDQFAVQALSGSTDQRISGFGVKDGIFYVLYLIEGQNSRDYKLYQYSK